MIRRTEPSPVEATIPSCNAAERSWDVIVLGAGPAGSMAARELARLGVRTLLVDKSSFPRGKVCGCCLGGLALDVLKQAGLGDVPDLLGASRSNRLDLSAYGRHCTLPLPEGAVVSREALDAELIRRAIAAGAEFLPDTPATVVEGFEHQRRQVQFVPSVTATDGIEDTAQCLRNGKAVTATAKAIVACDGLAGGALRNLTEMHRTVAPASRIGAGATLEQSLDCCPPGTIRMLVGSEGYLGMVQLPDGCTDLAASLDVREVRRQGVAGALKEIAINVGLAEVDFLDRASWRGTPRLTQRLDTVAVPGVFAVGDAAAYVEPFTGEGIGWALAGGASVAKSVLLAMAGETDASVENWRDCHQALLKRRMQLCSVVSQALRRPWVARSAVRLAATLPVAARPITACVHRPMAGIFAP